MRLLRVLTIFMICSYFIYGISIKMDSKRNFYCCKVEVPNKGTLDGSYLISGDQEDQTTVRVF